MTKNWRSSCVIVDLDGTIADIRHRLHFIQQQPKDWKSFLDACVDDKPYEYVIILCQLLSLSGLELIICSGRNESHREVTAQWLEDNGVYPTLLMMRKEKDYRPDTIIKREMLLWLRAHEFEPLFAIDDRPDVVKMWRENQVPCFQVDDHSWYEALPGQEDSVEWLKYMAREHPSTPMFEKCMTELMLHRSRWELKGVK